MNKKTINVLIMKDTDSGWWIAQCLEYDIAVQAKILKDVQYELQRVFVGRIFIADQLGCDPFEGIPAAPRKFQQLFDDSENTVKVELKPFKNRCGKSKEDRKRVGGEINEKDHSVYCVSIMCKYYKRY